MDDIDFSVPYADAEHESIASLMAALRVDVAACVVAWILSCRLVLLSDTSRDDGEEGVEEEEGYLTGDIEPFINSEDAIVVCPAVEIEESGDLLIRDDNIGSTGAFRGEILEMFLTVDLMGEAVSDL